MARDARGVVSLLHNIALLNFFHTPKRQKPALEKIEPYAQNLCSVVRNRQLNRVTSSMTGAFMSVGHAPIETPIILY